MKIRDQQIVKKILSEIEVIENLIMNFTQELFFDDEKTKRAVCMTLINIGELVKSTS